MLSRADVAIALVVLLLVLPREAVGQDSGCTSTGTRGRCWVSVTDPGRPSGPAPSPSSPASGKTNGTQGPAFTCVDRQWAQQPPAGDPMWGGHDPHDGTLKFQMCQGDGALLPWPRVVFAPNGQPAAVPQVSPAQLAKQAKAELGLEAPDIRLAPPGNSPYGATVGFPVWMWTARRPSTTGPVSKTAAADGISVTVTATLESISWSTGDGATVQCAGGGTPFTDDQAGSPSPTCGHLYSQPSSAAYAISATGHWSISWSGAGQGGTDTMSLTSQAQLAVREIRSLNSPVRGG